MLYFVRPPDAPFTALLALTHELATAGFRRRWTAQEYAGAFPTVAPWWSPTQAGREWHWLWEIHQRRQVYNVDDHHCPFCSTRSASRSPSPTQGARRASYSRPAPSGSGSSTPSF